MDARQKILLQAKKSEQAARVSLEGPDGTHRTKRVIKLVSSDQNTAAQAEAPKQVAEQLSKSKTVKFENQAEQEQLKPADVPVDQQQNAGARDKEVENPGAPRRRRTIMIREKTGTLVEKKESAPTSGAKGDQNEQA